MASPYVDGGVTYHISGERMVAASQAAAARAAALVARVVAARLQPLRGEL